MELPYRKEQIHPSSCLLLRQFLVESRMPEICASRPNPAFLHRHHPSHPSHPCHYGSWPRAESAKLDKNQLVKLVKRLVCCMSSLD